jgi:hypothetical protein
MVAVRAGYNSNIDCVKRNSCREKPVVRQWYLGCGKQCIGHAVCRKHRQEGVMVVAERNVWDKSRGVVG